MLKRSATLSTQVYQELLSWFKADQSVKNVDETGWRIAGDRAALIGASNDHASLFAVSHHRRREDVVRLIGDSSVGHTFSVISSLSQRVKGAFKRENSSSEERDVSLNSMSCSDQVRSMWSVTSVRRM